MTLTRPAAYGTLAVAAYAALALPGSPPGLGVLLAAVAVAWLLTRGERRDRWTVAYGGLGLALAGTAALRDARWVVAIDLVGAFALAVLVRVRASTWREAARAVTDLFPFACYAPWAVTKPVAEAVRARERGRLAPVLRGGALAGVLALVFGTLFATADRAFAQIAGDVLDHGWSLSKLPERTGAFLATVMLVGGLLLLPGTAPEQPAGAPARRLRRPEWAIPLGTLVAVFAAFVAVQASVLFGGSRHLLATAGLTYAEYARSGFFQLLAVAALTLAVVAVAVRWVPEEDWAGLRVLLGALCGLTLVILASAWRRLELYQEAFGATRLRLSVEATIVWLAVVFLLVLAAGIRMRGGWLLRATVLTAAAGLLAFTVSNPDARIARRTADPAYLATLSADAAPVLGCLPSPLPDTSWAGWNLARHRAREAPPCAYR